jgi:hypothetical protein
MVLDFLSRRHLARAREVKASFSGAESVVSRLLTDDCIQAVEPMGEKCFVITQKGTKELHDARESGWRPAGQAGSGQARGASGLNKPDPKLLTV